MKFQRFITAAVFAGIVGFAGCGDDDESTVSTATADQSTTTGSGGSTVTASCTTEAGLPYKICSEVAAAKSTVDAVLQACADAGGAPSNSACSPSGAVGKCTFGNAGGTNTAFFYAPAEKSAAETFCGQMSSGQGTFTAL